MNRVIALAASTALVIGMAACNSTSSDAQTRAVSRQQQTTDQLVKRQPAPDLTYSADRQALIERYKRTSDVNFRQYVAVFTPYGSLLYTGVVKGKVTPLDSQLSPADALQCQHNEGARPDGCGTVQLAEPNGTWGTNGGGVFWFDDRDVMHEVSTPGEIVMLQDQPFQVSSVPVLTINGQTPVGK